MGGHGSGRKWGFTKTTVEFCKSFDANNYARWGCFKLGSWSGTSRWTRNGNETGSCGHYIEINENYAFIIFSFIYDNIEHLDVKVNLSWYLPGFGGRRYFFECPHCYRRMRTLHLRGGEIACRICHDLTYESCLENYSVNNAYKAIAFDLKLPWQFVKRCMNDLKRMGSKEPKRPRGRPRKHRPE
jgi:hypothetical protein